MPETPNPEDELAGTEQPFVQHLMELRDRLVKAMIAIGVVAAALFFYPGPGQLYDLLAAPLVAHLPQGATMIATSVMFTAHVFKTTDTVQHITLLLMVYLLSYLMVSTHRYLSFKHMDIAKEKRFHLIVGMILLLILLATEPPITLFGASLLYILSGPVLAIKARVGKKKPAPISQGNPPH